MNLTELKLVQKKLNKFVGDFKDLFGRSERNHWCCFYLSGLILEGERKSIEPMANRVPGGNKQAMQQFVNQSSWDHVEIQNRLILWNKKKHKVKNGVLILDDTSLPKKGTHSVGVQRQYCGALGKIANCQSIVSWHYAEKKIHFPLAAELYLPKTWTEDSLKMKLTGVPKTRFEFKKKMGISFRFVKSNKKKIYLMMSLLLMLVMVN